MPEPKAQSKPPSKLPSKPPRRIWLFAPYIAVVLLAVVGSAGWMAAKIEVEHRVDAAAAAFRAQGFDVSWTGRKVDGFPFRLDLTLQAPRFADRTGWALSAPRITGEALVYDPGHWVFAAPSGVTLVRPGRGALDVSGQALRASVSGLDSAAPRFSIQGLKLVFAPQAGAAPAMLGGADLLEIHLQPGPDNQDALLIRLEGGHAPLPKILTGPADTLALVWDSRLSHMDALLGPDWPSRVKHWTAVGGDIRVVQAKLTLGSLVLDAKPATLIVGADGRLQGALPLSPGQNPIAKFLFRAAPIALSFEGGVARLGPLALGPALRVF
jgi:hypothetical protein